LGLRHDFYSVHLLAHAPDFKHPAAKFYPHIREIRRFVKPLLVKPPFVRAAFQAVSIDGDFRRFDQRVIVL